MFSLQGVEMTGQHSRSGDDRTTLLGMNTSLLRPAPLPVLPLPLPPALPRLSSSCCNSNPGSCRAESQCCHKAASAVRYVVSRLGMCFSLSLCYTPRVATVMHLLRFASAVPYGSNVAASWLGAADAAAEVCPGAALFLGGCCCCCCCNFCCCFRILARLLLLMTGAMTLALASLIAAASYSDTVMAFCSPGGNGTVRVLA